MTTNPTSKKPVPLEDDEVRAVIRIVEKRVRDAENALCELQTVLSDRQQAAEVREPSRLERVRAALPEGWEARAYGTNPQSRIWIGVPHGTYGYTYAEESTLTPEEAVEAAKKLAGVE